MTMGDSYCQRKERKMSRYKFKGYTITNCGYHQPDHCVWWEAVDENGEACFHGNTLREVEFMILDYEWEQKMRKKEEEIELLKESMPSGNAAAMREVVGDLLYMAERYVQKTPATESIIFEAKTKKEIRTINYYDVIAKAKAALSAPPRNCDIRTDFNDAITTLADERGWHDGKWDSERYCILASWLLATATERKGESDGK